MITKEIILQRSKHLQKIRDFFKDNNFLEVETPIMVPIPGMEPHLTPFETTLNLSPNEVKTKNCHIPLYLNTSPELQMKKLLGAGFQKIFNITKTFRNGEIGGPLHNPEFTILEWYRQKADYKTIMQDCEDLLVKILKKPTPLTMLYQGHQIDFSPPWPRTSIQEIFLKHCQIDLLQNQDFAKFKKTATEKKYDANGCDTWDDLFFKIFLNHIEPNLPKTHPIFLYDYPASQAALARKSAKNTFFAERFELYIAGIEIANAFSELIDPHEQRQRLREEKNLRQKIGKTVFQIDEQFLEALSQIPHPCAGIALGIDRLLMILLDKTSLEEVLLFPMTKMLDASSHRYIL